MNEPDRASEERQWPTAARRAYSKPEFRNLGQITDLVLFSPPDPPGTPTPVNPFRPPGHLWDWRRD